MRALRVVAIGRFSRRLKRPPQLALLVSAGLAFASCGPSRALFAGPVATTVVMRDYHFQYDPRIAAGRVVFTVHNQGPSVHQMALLPLPAGFPPIAQQLASSVRRPLGTLSYSRPIESGGSDTFAVDLVPGRYAMLSLTHDTKGVPDDLKGMAVEIQVR